MRNATPRMETAMDVPLASRGVNKVVGILLFSGFQDAVRCRFDAVEGGAGNGAETRGQADEDTAAGGA